MRLGRIGLPLFLITGALCLPLFAVPFSMFPKADHLVSPDGRFEVRDGGRKGSAGEFVGTFHSLWLTEVASGRSRKLCDYVGLAAVAWSSNDFLVVTQYLGKKTSRALVFAVAASQEPVLLDTPTLIRTVPAELRPTLRENDHTFVEASRLEGDIFYFQVWGYGSYDRSGFHWNCEYRLEDGKVSCAARVQESVLTLDEAELSAFPERSDLRRLRWICNWR